MVPENGVFAWKIKAGELCITNSDTNTISQPNPASNHMHHD